MTNHPALDVFLSRLEKVKRHPNGWTACCPHHKSKGRKLSITDKDDRILITCWSRKCDFRDIVASVGMAPRDFFKNSLDPESRRAYKIEALHASRDIAKNVIIMAGAQQTLTDEDIQYLSENQAKIDEIDKQLAELETPDDHGEDDENPNPFLKRLAYNSDEALDRIANQQWLIDSIVPADSFGVIYGPSGTYKSFLAMDMAGAIASAMKWHSHDVDNAGHVIYIAAEGAAGLHLRKKAWEIRHQHELTNMGILGCAVTINDAIECQHLIDLCDQAANDIQEPIRLVVIDTLARSFAGEENSATEMGSFVKSCDRIRERTGATVMVVHHAGKDADRGARGSSALRAACDFEFKVTSPGKKVSKLTCTKAKDSDPFEDMTFKLNVVEIGKKDRKGRELSSLTLTPANDADGGTGPRDDLTGHAQTLNNLLGHELARSGNDSVTTEFLRDAFYHRIGTKDRKAFSRAIEKLTQDEWIYVDPKGNISRDLPF